MPASGGGTKDYDYLSRGIIMFDTSSLPDDATIISAYLSLYCTNKIDFMSQSINFTSVTPTSTSAISTADYNVANYGSTKFSADTSITSLTLNAYNNFTLNASGLAAINLTGVTKFAVRLVSDITDTAPTATWLADTTSVASFHSGTNTNKPRLVVTYTSVSSVVSWVADALTDQAFILYDEAPIDAYFDTKAFAPAGLPNRYRLQKFYSLFSNIGSYNIQLGWSNGDFGSFRNYLVALSSNSAPVWGGGELWGDGSVWGGTPARIGQWTQANGFTGRTLKLRVRNAFANQPFTFEGFSALVTPKLRQR